jgi:O-antigen/teichoic acid export membrane protein
MKASNFLGKVSSTTKDGIIVFLARLSVIVGQLIYVKLYTHYLSLYELGIYFFLLTISYSLNALIFVPVDYYQQSKLYEYLNNGISLRSLLAFNWKLFCWFSSVTGIVFIFFVIARPSEVSYFILIIVAAISLYLNQALRGGINNLEHKRLAAISLILETILRIGTFAVLLEFMAPNAITLITSSIFSLICVSVFLSWQAKKLGLFSQTSDKLINISATEVFNFAYPISISAIFNWIQLQGYRLILVPLGFAEMVGIYATIENIGKAGMGAVSSVFGQIFVPNIYKTSGKYTSTYLRNAILLIAFVLIVSLVFSDVIVTAVTNEAFAKYSWVLLLGVITEAGNFLAGALAIHITITTSTRRMMSASLLGVASMIAVFAAIYSWGVVSVETVGIPVLTSQIIVVIYMYIVFKNSTLGKNK